MSKLNSATQSVTLHDNIWQWESAEHVLRDDAYVPTLFLCLFPYFHKLPITLDGLL